MERVKPSGKDQASNDGLLRGPQLREAVKTRLGEMKDKLRDPAFSHIASFVNPPFTAVYEHLDDLGINWDTPRDRTQLSPFFASTFTAINYARLKTEGETIPISRLATPDDAWSAINEVLEDPVKREIFDNNMWRLPTTLLPNRGVPLQYVLSNEFKNRATTGITCIDIGAGTGIALPLLNSSRYTDYEFPERQQLMQLLDNDITVPINFGLNVDRTRHDENVDWAKANSWSHPKEFTAILNEIEPKMNRFSNVTVDITDINAVSDIKEALQGHEEEPKAIVTSFVRYQLGNNPRVQEAFEDSIGSLLNVGDIWIDIGEELLNPDHHLESYAVNVYKKTPTGLVKNKGGEPPFHIDEGGKIVQVQTSYFLAA